MQSQARRAALRGMRPASLLAVVLWCGSPAAQAHDSWLRVADAQLGSGLLVLELAAGNRYPRADRGATPAASVTQSGCTGPDGRQLPLLVRREGDEALELRSRTTAPGGASCWVDLRPVELALSLERVRVYFDEIRPSAAARAAWAAQQARGIAWREVYRKHMRIELPPQGAAESRLAALRQPRRTGLELLPLDPDAIVAGRVAHFQALLEGQPVPQLAVEFVSERSPLGVWRQTDAQGRFELALPLAGRWLLRTTLLDLPVGPREPWRSRFATLAIQVQPSALP